MCRCPTATTLRRHVDLAGRRRLDELPDGTWLRYRYDAEGHPSAIEHSDGERVDYAVGARSLGGDPHARTTTIHLDDGADGLPAAVEQCVDGIVLRADYRHGPRRPPGRGALSRAPGWLEVVPDGPRAVALRVGGPTYARAEATGATTTVTFANGATTVERLGGPPSRLGDDDSRRSASALDGGAAGQSGHHHRARRADVFHDAAGPAHRRGRRALAYDAAGRLVAGPTVAVGYGVGPQAAWSVTPTGHTDTATTCWAVAPTRASAPSGLDYRYDLFGQLAAVERSRRRRIDAGRRVRVRRLRPPRRP